MIAFLGLLTLVLLLKLLFSGSSRKSQHRGDLPLSQPSVDITPPESATVLKEPEALPPAHSSYRLRRSLLTQSEQAFYHRLQGALPESILICPQVRLADVIQQEDYGYRHLNRISAKSLDFVLVDRVTFTILSAVELDDCSHARRDRRDRDRFVNEALATAGLRLFRYASIHSDLSDLAEYHAGRAAA